MFIRFINLVIRRLNLELAYSPVKYRKYGVTTPARCILWFHPERINRVRKYRKSGTNTMGIRVPV